MSLTCVGRTTYLLWDYGRDLFPDVPGQATGIYHDSDVGESLPVKQRPYRVGPVKAQTMEGDVQYMLDNVIEPCNSSWLSPCHSVRKGNGTSWRFVTDFRKVNKITTTDSYPLPRIDAIIDTLIDTIGDAKFVTKLDLLKGYWQVPLTENAKDITSFSAGNNLFRYLVCSFGFKNSS